MTLVEQIAKNGYEYKRGCSWEKASLCVRNFWLSLAEQMITELRLVQLAKDQTPAGITPDKDTKLEGEEYRRGVWAGYNLAINDHKIEGWRKVILSERENEIAKAQAKTSYEAGQKDGRQEVVGWIKANKMKLMQPAKMGCYQNVGKEELETKLKDWGLE